MRLDLADRLRCPRAHAPSPLVVVARRVDGRELLSGYAGCPVCHVEALIENGVIRFPARVDETGTERDTVPNAGGDTAPDAAYARDVASPGPSVATVPDDDLTRLAALLGLDEPGGTVLLTGAYSRFAVRLAAEMEVTVVVVGSPPHAVDAAPGVCFVALPEPAVPFSDHTFRAAALDHPGTTSRGAAFVADAIRTVAIGGRVVGAAALPLPDDVKELARDEREWVGERERAASRITLGRAGAR